MVELIHSDIENSDQLKISLYSTLTLPQREELFHARNHMTRTGTINISVKV